MWKRTVVLFFMLMTCMALLMVSLTNISTSAVLVQAAQQQSAYRVDIAALRGTIYDCRGQAVTGREENLVAAVSPSVEAANALSQVLPAGEMASVYRQLTQGIPFALALEKQPPAAQGLLTFSVPQRYGSDGLLTHITGYLDGNGQGVSGIELAYNDYLSAAAGEISVTYQVDALKRALAGEQPQVNDTSYRQTQGVVLTIDTRLQKIAQRAAEKYLDKGAVIIAEVPTCSLRAVVSVPNFDQNDISQALNDEDSPLLNRAFTAYNVGSVFKLVTASAALEAGISPNTRYECTGSIDVDGAAFHCLNGVAHGEVDMKEAIAQSCNDYFVYLAQQLQPQQLLDMAQAMGFGQEQELAPGLISQAGNLPALRNLSSARAMANLSFGQGELLATPLQITALVNTVASGGIYTPPSLVERLVDDQMQTVEQLPAQAGKRVISSSTAAKLRQYMQASVESGTSRLGKPANLSAGAKTATAETGVLDGEREVIQAWYAGYYPADNPKYVIVVLAEDGEGGGSSCGPVFQQIADDIYRRLPGLLVS